MTAAIACDPIYRHRRFQSETIELCVCWYATYRHSYRDLVEMMAGARHHRFPLDYSAVGAAVRARVREALESLCPACAFVLEDGRDCGIGAWRYSLPLPSRRQARRDRRFRKSQGVATDAARDPEWRSVVVRSRRYLNNIVEQDHRAIKRRCAPMLALKSFRTAAVTLAGVELAHRIRKRQFSFGRGGLRRFCSLIHLWARALACHGIATERRKVTIVALNRHCNRTQTLAC
jgi:transposase-like protein